MTFAHLDEVMPQQTVTDLLDQDIVGRILFKMNGVHCLALANVIITITTIIIIIIIIIMRKIS